MGSTTSLLVLAAAPANTSAPPATASKPAAAQSKTGGTIRVALSTDIANLEPHINTGGATESIFPVFDRLTQYDSLGKPQPQLAESWEVRPDYKQFKLSLRKTVLFHTGREFTSDYVKYSMLRVRDPKVGSAQYEDIEHLSPLGWNHFNFPGGATTLRFQSPSRAGTFARSETQQMPTMSSISIAGTATAVSQ